MIEQRCLFHKLRNVTDNCRSEFKGEQKREEKKQFLEQARAVYQAESAEEAKRRLVAWADAWRERAPKGVATLERDFEQTIANSRLPQIAREWVRTTSLLERTNRQLRRKFRQVGSFGSEIGAEVAMYVQVKRLNAHWSKQAWWDTSLALYFDFRNLNP